MSGSSLKAANNNLIIHSILLSSSAGTSRSLFFPITCSKISAASFLIAVTIWLSFFSAKMLKWLKIPTCVKIIGQRSLICLILLFASKFYVETLSSKCYNKGVLHCYQNFLTVIDWEALELVQHLFFILN